MRLRRLAPEHGSIRAPSCAWARWRRYRRHRARCQYRQLVPMVCQALPRVRLGLIASWRNTFGQASAVSVNPVRVPERIKVGLFLTPENVLEALPTVKIHSYPFALFVFPTHQLEAADQRLAITSLSQPSSGFCAIVWLQQDRTVGSPFRAGRAGCRSCLVGGYHVCPVH